MQINGKDVKIQGSILEGFSGHFQCFRQSKKFDLFYRPYWRCYYANTDAIIYVVDSCDNDRLGISRSELVSMLEVRGLIPLCELLYVARSEVLILKCFFMIKS